MAGGGEMKEGLLTGKMLQLEKESKLVLYSRRGWLGNYIRHGTYVKWKAINT